MKNVVTRVTLCYSLLEARIVHGYSLVTHWLLVHALLQLFDAVSYKVPN